MKRALKEALLFVCFAAATHSLAQNASASLGVDIVSGERISPPSGGWYYWYEMAADPADPNNLMVCGSQGVANDNAFYGFVFSSSDGGKTWRTVLEDKNSAWVTEQSCAFGMNG